MTPGSKQIIIRDNGKTVIDISQYRVIKQKKDTTEQINIKKREI